MCLNSSIGFVGGSLPTIPAGHKNILVIGYCAETQDSPVFYGKE